MASIVDVDEGGGRVIVRNPNNVGAPKVFTFDQAYGELSKFLSEIPDCTIPVNLIPSDLIQYNSMQLYYSSLACCSFCCYCCVCLCLMCASVFSPFLPSHGILSTTIYS